MLKSECEKQLTSSDFVWRDMEMLCTNMQILFVLNYVKIKP